MVAISI